MRLFLGNDEWAENGLLLRRELNYKQGYRSFEHLGYTKNRVRWLDRGNTVLEHDGCINTVKWNNSGDLLYTGSDDRKIKIWRLGSSFDEIKLCHTIETRHRRNIFCVEPSPLHDDLILSAAADGYIRSSYLGNNNTGTSILSSEDIVHMFKYDQDQPNVIYSAEETGHIHRIDLRFNNSKELLYENKSSCYRNSPVYDDDSKIKSLLPRWNGRGDVKAIMQTPTISSPHLLVGGRGLVIGLLDLRITNRASSEASNQSSDNSSTSPALINTFTKMWSPLFSPNTKLPFKQNPKKSFLIDKYSQLSCYHPWSTARFQSNITQLLPPSHQKLQLEIAISGFDISKDGQKILASYRNDQIYTFQLTCPDGIGGTEEMFGGHINYATFLKSVRFFGPNDEYVVSGSDSGHFWMWESSPYVPSDAKQEESSFCTTVCPVVTVMKADNRTCNGVIPNPVAPILASYGIDSDAKIWAFRTFDQEEQMKKDPFTNINEAELIKFNHENANAVAASSSSSSFTMNSVSNKSQQYYLCKHEGLRDNEKYTRYSLPLLLHNTQSPYNAMNNFPYLLEVNKIKACSLYAERLHHKLRGRQYPQVLSPYNFNDTVYNLRAVLLEENKRRLIELQPTSLVSSSSSLASSVKSRSTVPIPVASSYEVLKKDFGHYMPSETLFELLDLNNYSSISLDYFKERFSVYNEKLGLTKNPMLLETMLNKLYELFLRHNTIKRNDSMDFFHYLEVRESFYQQSNQILYYLFIPYLEFLHVVDIAKLHGNEAYKLKSLDCAHYFYLKAIRYLSSILTLDFIELIDEEDEEPIIKKKKNKEGEGEHDQVSKDKDQKDKKKKKKKKRKNDFRMKTETRIIASTIATSSTGAVEVICGECVMQDDDDNDETNPQLTAGRIDEIVANAINTSGYNDSDVINNIVRRQLRQALGGERDLLEDDVSNRPRLEDSKSAEGKESSEKEKSDEANAETVEGKMKALTLEEEILGERLIIEEIVEEEIEEESEIASSGPPLSHQSSYSREDDREKESEKGTVSSSNGMNEDREDETVSTLPQSPIPDRFTPLTEESMEIANSEEYDDNNDADDEDEDEAERKLDISSLPAPATKKMSAEATTRKEDKDSKMEADKKGKVEKDDEKEEEKEEVKKDEVLFDEKLNRSNITKLCFRITHLIQEEIVPDLLYTLFNNLAMTFLAMEKYQDAVNICDDAIHFAQKYHIEVDAKLLFRRGTSNVSLHHYEEALEDLQKAMTLNPKDNIIQLKYKEAKRLHDMKRKREKKIYSKMFDD